MKSLSRNSSSIYWAWLRTYPKSTINMSGADSHSHQVPSVEDTISRSVLWGTDINVD